MTTKHTPEQWRIMVWEAIDVYVEKCGGDASERTVSDDRVRVATKIERLLRIPAEEIAELLIRIEGLESEVANLTYWLASTPQG